MIGERDQNATDYLDQQSFCEIPTLLACLWPVAFVVRFCVLLRLCSPLLHPRSQKSTSRYIYMLSLPNISVSVFYL